MKEIEWVGPARSTKYGLMISGRKVTVSEKDAASFIKQLLAIPTDIKTTKPEEG